MKILAYFRIMYTVGYCVSLVSLSLALIILLLFRSTLTLIPLLGLHEVVFAVLTEEHTEGILRYVNLFFQLFFNSFQGLLVAILYCFLNKEVQAEIKKKWQRWKLGMTDLDDLRNTGSNTPQVGANVSLFSHPSPCLATAHFLNDSRLAAPPPPPPPPPAIGGGYNHRQDQLGARQLKTYCYIPVHRQDGGADDVNSCESCC
ncbi:hypothetical protein PAMA_020167 [Pampus argenteus]